MSNNNAIKEHLESNPVAAWLDKRAKLALQEAGIDEKKTAPEPNKKVIAPEAEDKNEKKGVPHDEPDPFARQIAEIDKVRYIHSFQQLGTN
jgi:hypothetical protein